MSAKIILLFGAVETAKYYYRSLCSDEPLGFSSLVRKKASRRKLLFYVPGGILSLQSRLRSIPFEAYAPTNHWGSHPLYAKKLPEGSFFFTSQEGFEPPTDGLEGRCSILLSY